MPAVETRTAPLPGPVKMPRAKRGAIQSLSTPVKRFPSVVLWLSRSQPSAYRPAAPPGFWLNGAHAKCLEDDESN